MMPFLLPPRPSGGDITTGLLTWWKFDAGSGTNAVDSGSAGTDGTLTNDFGANPSWVTGMIGPFALQFANSNFGWVQNATSRTLTGNVTVACWAQLTGTLVAQATIAGLLDGGTGIKLGFRADHTGDRCFSFIGVSGTNLRTATSAISTSTWYHIAGVWNSGVLTTAYLNAVSQATTESSGVAIEGALGITLGIDRNSETHGLNGMIDDFRVYNRALSQADITTLFAYR
jgi:hypothetical protein